MQLCLPDLPQTWRSACEAYRSMAKTQAVTILFCDLVASTERRARLGDDAFDEFSAGLFVVLRDSIERAGGREVSNAGDGMMIVFPDSVADAVSCALELHESVAALDRDDPPRLRVGISCGEVAQQGDNYSGMPIVEAARLESAATPGQTLANSVVRTLVGNRRAFQFRDVGNLTLKGIPEPLPTVEIVTSSAEAAVAITNEPRPAARHPRRWGTPRHKAFVGTAVALALVASGIAVATTRGRGSNKRATTPDGVSTPTTLRRDYPIAYVRIKCPAADASRVPGLECNRLTVPEDRSKPHGRVVKLDVYRAPARGNASARSHASADPTLDFGADDLASSPARDHGDEFQLAQRGWGGSPGSVPALTCPKLAPIAADALTKPSGDLTIRARESAALRACHGAYADQGIDLSKYDLLTAGDDMVDLIRALHLRHVNLVSGYVATISALEVDRQLPDVVRTMTLQEPVPGGRSRYSDPTRLLSDAFKSYVALCRADPTCRAAYPDLGASLLHDWNVYRLHPRIVLGDAGDGHPRQVLIDGPRVSQAIFAGLADRGDYDLLAAGIAATDRSGAVDQLTAGRILVYNDARLDPTFDWGAELSEACSYDQYTTDPGHELSSKIAPDLSGVDDGFLGWACKAWPVKKVADVAFDDPTTSVPTFLVSGNLAPNSDQLWPDTFQQSLPHATVAVFPSLNAVVLSFNLPRCLAELRRRFLDAPDASLDPRSCVSDSPAIHFATSGLNG
jgi:class 3 adenylate cyclase